MKKLIYVFIPFVLAGCDLFTSQKIIDFRDAFISGEENKILPVLTDKSRSEYEFFIKSVIVLTGKESHSQAFKNIECSSFLDSGECSFTFDHHTCNLPFKIKKEAIHSDWKRMINSCKPS